MDDERHPYLWLDEDETLWLYYNAGNTNRLLNTDGVIYGGTYFGLSAEKTSTECAYYQTNQAKCFDIPKEPELWIKFDVYFDGVNRWRAYNGGVYGISGITAQKDGRLNFFSNGSNVTPNASNNFAVLNSNTLQTVLLHMLSGSSDGVIEAWVDGENIYRYVGDVNHGEEFADIYLQCDGSGTLFSNVTITNDASQVAIFDCRFKPELYISWIPAGKIVISPEVYISYLQAPIRQKVSADLSRNIATTAKTFADLESKNGQREKIFADVLRGVVEAEKVVSDTKRAVKVANKQLADTFLSAVQSNRFKADTFRELKKSEKINGDTSRRIGLITISGDLQRKIIRQTKSANDTRRTLGIHEKILGDLCFKGACAEKISADISRKLTTTIVTKADSQRKIGVREKTIAATTRIVAQRELATAKTFLRLCLAEKNFADLLRGLREFVRLDTLREIKRVEKCIASTVIRIPHILLYTFQEKERNLRAPIKAGFLKATRADDSADDDEEEEYSLLDTFKSYKVTAINITLNERTLSDTFSFETASKIGINEAVEGKFLDYSFRFLAEETSEIVADNAENLIQTVKGMYDQDKLLYTQFFLPVTEIVDKDGGIKEEIPLLASDYMQEVADCMGLTAAFSFDDFTPYNINSHSRITYVDLVNSLFGWTSRLPHRQINVFIRDDKLYVIQRGKESGTTDITKMKYSPPTVEKKLIRSLWSNPKSEELSELHNKNKDNDPTIDYQYEDYVRPFSGTISFSSGDCDISLKYSKGLLVKETNNTYSTKITHTSTTTYGYIEYFAGKSDIQVSLAKAFNKNFYGEFYLAKKSISSKVRTLEELETNDNGTSKPLYKTINQYGTTIYDYDVTNNDIFLYRESEDITTTTIDESTGDSETETTSNETYHFPLGNGWYAQSVYRNGAIQGANISQGKPGNKVSQYTMAEVQKILTGWTVTPNNDDDDDDDDDGSNKDEDSYEDKRRKLAPIADISFPVRELDLLSDLTEELLWFNRKIQETVTLDLISKVEGGKPEDKHIIDFTEKVKFNGAEYFLVSNTISFTPRKFIQTLQLVRWY